MGLNGRVTDALGLMRPFVSCVALAWAFAQGAAGQGFDLTCQRGCPDEVTLRVESGEMAGLQTLLLEHNPEYARLSFGDPASSKGYEGKQGWSSWYSGDKFFVFKRHPKEENGFLYLDGSCNWLVRDLVQMKDESFSIMENTNNGAFPANYNEDFFLVGGYGYYRYNQNWLKWDPRGYFAHGFTQRHGFSIYGHFNIKPPDVIHSLWRDDSRHSYFYLADGHALGEPNLFPGPNMTLLPDSVTNGIRRFQIWQIPDTSAPENAFRHVYDLNPAVFGNVPPMASVESQSWVIFVDVNSITTSVLHKERLEYIRLDNAHQLPFGSQRGLHGWMMEGDTLMVVDQGEITQTIDLNAFIAAHQSPHLELERKDHALLLKPKAKITSVNEEQLISPEGIALLVLISLIIIGFLYGRLRPTKLALDSMASQVQIIEYFSRLVHQYGSAQEIMEEITRECVSRLNFDLCEIYLLDDAGQAWVQQTRMEKGAPLGMGKGRSLSKNQGIVGLVGQSGQAHLLEGPESIGRFALAHPEQQGELAMPIISDGRVFGIILLGVCSSEPIDDDRQKVIQHVANLFGQKLGKTLSEKQTQEYSEVYMQNPGPVLRLNANGVVLLNNASAIDQFGQDAEIGKRIQIDDIVRGVNASLNHGRGLVFTAAHQSRIYQVNLLPYPDLGYVNMYASDVTELEQARSRAEKAERAKTDFLSVMSHEIRTPLNAIMGLNELLLKANPSESQVKQLKYMQYSGKQLLSLVNDILSLESLEDAKAAMKPSTFNVHELMHRLAETFADQAKARGNVVEVVCPPAEEAWVSGDRHWVSQMVNNLLDNAVKFTQRGTITLSTRPSAQPERWIIDVEDSGIGIAADHLARITDPFEQVLANPKNTAADQGTGLGLAIVKKLATLHGGELQVQSTEGVGSKFTLNLAITPSDAPETSSATTSNSGHLADPQGLRVLIVDDNAMNLMVAKKQVEMLGHKVISAIHGQEAVEKWRQHHPDFILMDLQMPVMDGMEATRQIRRLIQKSGVKHVPIVALTADAESSTHDEALAAGLDEVLVKPADTETLRQAIARGVLGAKG